MSDEKAAGATWDRLPPGVQQHVLAFCNNACVRRVSKAFKNAYDAANHT